ncbi:MAG TPA: hypothetical protein H9733_01940 [Candidatus Anaerotignum merdipullorum]|nr:hypothetical protein [Candidatus Anaerotignum merdipullorum]
MIHRRAELDRIQVVREAGGKSLTERLDSGMLDISHDRMILCRRRLKEGKSRGDFAQERKKDFFCKTGAATACSGAAFF